MYVIKPEHEEREAIIQILSEMEEYYGETLTDKRRLLFAEDLVELGPKLTREAANKYRKSWGKNKFPYPSELRKQIFFISRGAALGI